MTNEQIAIAIREGRVAAVLLSKGGWITSPKLVLANAPNFMWVIRRYSAKGVHLRDLYVEPETIVGISIVRTEGSEDDE